MTHDIMALTDWLMERGVTHVAMESSGVFWKPIYNLMEGLGLTILVVNAQHIKAVPGRKTDVKDAEWIAELMQHGLLRGSYIPDRSSRELRELVRYRRSLIEQRAQVVNRIQKVLEGANIKLSGVATDVVGVSGRAILEAMVAGIDDPAVLSELARGRLRKKLPELNDALTGLIGHHQRLLVASQLRHLDFLDREIDGLNQEVAELMHPLAEALERLDSIPGMGQRTSEEVLAEIGSDMSRFPTKAHLASWAKLCPGNNESAGKRMSGRTGHGNRWLRASLVEAAWGAAHTRGTYLSSQYNRIASRRGRKRAIIALAHTILGTIYFLLRDGIKYQDLGGNYFDERDRERFIHRAVNRIERLGFRVELEAV